MTPGAHSFTLLNARLPSGEVSSLRVTGGLITSIGAGPLPADLLLDLQGDWLLPGLINAHDHLQLNGLPSETPFPAYTNVRGWIADVDRRRRFDESFKARTSLPRNDRLLIGGIKNLLSGVTTVAHHDPLYEALRSHAFPVSVVQSYGWAHSLQVDGEAAVQESFQDTPAETPWMIHAAEGVDADAHTEFGRLDRLRCIGSNTLLIHGIALKTAERDRLYQAGGGLIWCPASNLKLFGRSADIRSLALKGRVALGSDSRLSGSKDLLEELRSARDTDQLESALLPRLVGCDAAALLRLPDRGALRTGLRADLVVLPAEKDLLNATRSDVRLVIVGGEARYGDEDVASALAPEGFMAAVQVDGRAKLLARFLVEALQAASSAEEGLKCRGPRIGWKAA
jgi:cytosine/adenosine deaminase-related metal-dependent hydrolase